MTVRALFLLLVALAPSVAEAGKNSISGRVLDRNGQPVERAIITLAPGNVELITDADGTFWIDYLRDSAGERVKLAKKANYALEVFKPGFHTASVQFYYKKGAFVVEDQVLKEDSIVVEDDGSTIDPGLFADPTQSSGATYEGQ